MHKGRGKYEHARYLLSCQTRHSNSKEASHFHPSESDRIKPTVMPDVHAGKKEGDEPPKDDDTREKDLPPPWAAAMAREIVRRQ